MSENFTLNATKREKVKGAAKKQRKERQVPGVVYGYGTEPFGVSVDASEILKLFRKAGQSSVIELEVEGTTYSVLIQEYQKHPVLDHLTHLDFMSIDMKASTTAHVPVEVTGVSPAVKMLGGILIINHDKLEVRCLPKDLPSSIVVDISGLEELHDHVSIEQLGLSDKIEVLHFEADEVVISVTGHTVVEDEDETTTEVPATEVASAE